MEHGRLTRFDTNRSPHQTEVTVQKFDNETDSDYQYAYFVNTPNAQINLRGEGMTGKTGHEDDAFNLDSPNDAQVGLACKDGNGNSFILVLFGGAKDLVYRKRRDNRTGEVLQDILKLDGFTDELMSRPLTIGSKPARLDGDLMLMGALAQYAGNTDTVEEVTEGHNAKRNPLAIANEYYLDYLRTHPE